MCHFRRLLCWCWRWPEPVLRRAWVLRLPQRAAPLGPIDAVELAPTLKLACGQGVEGFDQVVGEKMYRSMLIVQCRAVVGTIVELVAAGKYSLNDTPIWQCVENREDHDALTVAFVQWVGRRPALLRKTCGGGVRRSDRDEREVPQLS